MLQLKHIRKEYRTGELVQKALDDVSLNLRDNEFVAILGPSGSGKTTLLNIVGGLDRYDSGDLVINGVSTKKYTDRDWDSYRNHTIGFVFQSYNLIPHQTVLANVELALTISGISKAERRRRAAKALEDVGLGNQLHKHPSEMSGGQMQRVAIARALVNNPDILLADEPTGALDSDTSIQVMELLKTVAKDRLVVMVTHNPELAEQYATRIVRLKDGVIRSDTDPFEPDTAALTPPVHKNLGHSSMSPLTALSLSFNNLLTKKARTLLTAFAGSIGIIGIALILSLSNGVNGYIEDMEKSTLSEYPLQISSNGFDFTSLMNSDAFGTAGSSSSSAPEGMVSVRNILSRLTAGVSANDLTALKDYLDSDECTIQDDASAVEYSYAVSPLIYRQDADGSIYKVNPDTTFSELNGGSVSTTSIMSSMMSPNVFGEMAETPELYKDQYDIKAGRWAEKYDECILVLNADGSISDYALYTLGLRDQAELDKALQQYAQNQNITLPEDYGTYSYDDFLGKTFKVVSQADCYSYDEAHGIWLDKSGDEDFMKNVVAGSTDLKIVGIVQPKADSSSAILPAGVAYLHDLTNHVIDEAASSEIVRQQLADPETNVLTGEPFDSKDLTDIDLASMFSVDTDALKNAFQFDAGALDFDLSDAFDLSGGSLDLSSLFNSADFSLDLSGVDLSGVDLSSIDLSGIDLSGIDFSSIELPPMDDLDMSQLFDGMDISIPPDALQSLMKKILTGYKDYVIGNGILHLDKIGFRYYMESDQFKQILASSMGELLDTDGLQEQFTEALQKNLQGVMESYSAQVGQQLMQQIGDQISDQLNGELGQQLAAQLGTALQTQISSALQGQLGSSMEALMQQLLPQFSKQLQTALQDNISQLGGQMEGALKIDASAFQNAIQLNMSGSELTEMVKSAVNGSSSSYDSLLNTLGYADYEKPDAIWIYPSSFEAKNRIVEKLDAYNDAMEAKGEEDKAIHYTDTVGTLMDSVTQIVGMVSNVLVAFVAISLVVSSIMIGVITYISVLERRKEIGVLRAIGASKHNVSEVFNAETFIIGLCSGVMGVVLSLLLLIPGNMLIHNIAGNDSVTASLPPTAALILIVLATFLTILGGLIPAKSAAKSNPVIALRSE